MTLMTTATSPRYHQQSLEELASGSLPTLGCGADASSLLQPSWSRSLHELAAANKALLGGSAQQPTSSAQVLLGNRTDFGSLLTASKSIAETKPTSSDSSSSSHHYEQEVFVSIESTHKRHRDGIMERILKKEREATQKALEASLQRQIDEDWARERDWWQKEIVGSRNLVDASNTSLKKERSTFQTSISGPSYHTHLKTTSSASSAPLNIKMIQEHLNLVQHITTNAELSDVLNEFSKLSQNSEKHGYLIAWQLLSNMLPTGLTTGFDGARGALVHFCKQYQTVIKSRVASANLAGQNTFSGRNYGTGMGGTIAAYVHLEFGADATIWHILYYCEYYSI
jgi:hypothetical protein